MSSKRLILLDSSTMALSDCMRKVQFTNRMGLVPKVGSDPLDFGQALHRGIAHYRSRFALGQPCSIEESIEDAVKYYMERPCPKDSPRTVDNLRAVLNGYLLRIPQDPFMPLVTPDKQHVALEIPFKIPLYSDQYTDVLLSGVVDGVGHYGRSSNAKLCIFDTKHSSTTNIRNHLREQLERPQFHVYSYAMSYLGYGEPGTYLPVVIDGIYIDKSLGGRFERSEVKQIERHLIERTLDNARHLAKQMAELSDDIEWPHNYTACHGKYRLCEYNCMCALSSEQQAIPLKYCFTKRVYDPTTFGD